MMELLQFIAQDDKHFIGTILVGWLFFAGLEGVVKAWRGKS